MNALDYLHYAAGALDTFRTQLVADTAKIAEFTRRLEQICSQLHKNTEVRDTAFAMEFNSFCLDLRTRTDQHTTVWATVRAEVRKWTRADYQTGLALPAKGFNNKAKTFSRACDEFTTAYYSFYRIYKGYTAQKLNVFLLSACNTDINNITDKILFLAREIAKNAERFRG